LKEKLNNMSFDVPPDPEILKQSYVMCIEALLITMIDKAIAKGIELTGTKPGENLLLQQRNIFKCLEGYTYELNMVLLHIAWSIGDTGQRDFFIKKSLEMKKIFFGKVANGEEIVATANINENRLSTLVEGLEMHDSLTKENIQKRWKELYKSQEWLN
tara:strand:+ start:72 stop:545 length:474 start_codon:yes stop_codon:yes gene_type:complete